jgi:pimeloyl-ACP methyl ester carboxylesterase
MPEVLTALALVLIPLALYGLFGAAFNVLDLGEPLHLSRVGWSRYFREFGAHMLCGTLIPFGWRDPGPARTPGAEEGQPPVLLVPGYGMNRACWFFLVPWLRRRGFPWVWATNYGSGSRGIPEFAVQLAEKVERLCRASGARQVDIVAHSMGGVIAAWYVARLDGHLRVRRLITIGTPWRGTRLHVFGLRRQAHDMAPDSRVIAEIQNPPVSTLAIWSRTDHLVHPSTGGRGEGMADLEVVGRGHLEMVISLQIFRAVRDRLVEAAPAALGGEVSDVPVGEVLEEPA